MCQQFGGKNCFKQLENVEYCNYLVSIVTNVARRTRKIESSVDLAKAAFNMKTPCTSQLDSDLPKALVKCYIWSIAQYSAETRTLSEIKKNICGKF
jgi:hypothetical protein